MGEGGSASIKEDFMMALVVCRLRAIDQLYMRQGHVFQRAAGNPLACKPAMGGIGMHTVYPLTYDLFRM